MAAPPLPPFQLSAPTGPSQAADYGGTRDVGTLTVGDYYARGSRVRRSEGVGWLEMAIVGAVGLGGLYLWTR